MGLTTDKIKLPLDVTKAVINKVSNTSTIASLSPSTPMLFKNVEFMTFNGASEAEVVAEGQKKSSYEQTLDYVTAQRVKIQTTTRVSSELKWADEDNQFQIISDIQEDQAKALARALDYIIYHAVNPKTGEKITGFEALMDTATQVNATGVARTDVDALSSALNEDYEINGVALSRKWANQLRTTYIESTGARVFPEIPLNLNAGNLEGVPAATSTTVNGAKLKTPSNVLGIMGDFEMIKWGMVRDLESEIIEFGDPDQTGEDLKAHNQIAYRTEAMLGFAVIDPKAFAVLKSADANVSKAAKK